MDEEKAEGATQLNDNEILIDSKNQQAIREILKVRQEIEIRLQLVLQTLINSKDLTGDYILSDDLTKLIKLRKE